MTINVQAEANKLFNAIVLAERKANNTGARLSVLMHTAIAQGELPKDIAIEFSKGTSRQRANTILHDLCDTYSQDYKHAYEDAQNKELSKELRGQADKVCKAIRKAMTRSLYIGAYAYDRNVQAMNVNKQGDIVLNAGTEDAETFSLRSAETNAKRHFGRTGQGIVKEQDNGEPAIPVSLALKATANMLAGKDASELSPQIKALAQDALITLLGVFNAEDAKAIERLYKDAA